MATMRSTILAQWMLQLTSCWTSVVIAVAAATSISGTVAVRADVGSVSPAASEVCVRAGHRTDADCDDNDDDDNSDDDSGD